MTDPATPLVLVVDDEPAVRRLIVRTLELEGFRTIEAADGPDAVHSLNEDPDLVLLDVNLPTTSGLDVLQEIRAGGNVPVILLTGQAGESDRIAGLDLGADDYVPKPFSPGELAARVRSVLRRSQPRGDAGPAQVQFGTLGVDLKARSATLDGAPIPMTRLEFDLLAHLVRRPSEAFSRDELLKEVWGSSAAWQDPSTVTEHVRRLRIKIEADPLNPEMIKTVRGVGYLFDPGAAHTDTDAPREFAAGT
ncbi:MAG TPA: response regulator transcription factor [Acidimicrobiales bacterium]|nr:response regulator transcription factor [Acidimicrobiales bacterium]